MWELKLFGRFQLNGPLGPVELASAKLRALLAYLALLEPKGETREHLTSLLWPKALPYIPLHRQEKASALAWRKFARHDFMGIVDKILGCWKYAHDQSGLITRDDGDPGSV
jgi:hypothetical protein